MDDMNLSEADIQAEALRDLQTAYERSISECEVNLIEATTPAWRLYWQTRLQLLRITLAALPETTDAVG